MWVQPLDHDVQPRNDVRLGCPKQMRHSARLKLRQTRQVQWSIHVLCCAVTAALIRQSALPLHVSRWFLDHAVNVQAVGLSSRTNTQGHVRFRGCVWPDATRPGNPTRTPADPGKLTSNCSSPGPFFLPSPVPHPNASQLSRTAPRTDPIQPCLTFRDQHQTRPLCAGSASCPFRLFPPFPGLVSTPVASAPNPTRHDPT